MLQVARNDPSLEEGVHTPRPGSEFGRSCRSRNGCRGRNRARPSASGRPLLALLHSANSKRGQSTSEASGLADLAKNADSRNPYLAWFSREYGGMLLHSGSLHPSSETHISRPYALLQPQSMSTNSGPWGWLPLHEGVGGSPMTGAPKSRIYCPMKPTLCVSHQFSSTEPIP